MSSASAATVTLDHGFLKITLPDAFEIIDGTTGPVVLNGFDPAPGTGAYTVETTDVTFPEFSGTLFGFPLSVQVTPLANLTGTYNEATGALNGNVSNWSSTIDFNGDECLITPIPLAFTTNTNTVFEGNAFDAGTPPVNGAVSDDWAALPAGTGPGCGLINPATNGPGGLWLSNNIAQPTFVPPAADPPATPAPTTPKKKKCKKKKKKGKSGASAAKGCKKKKKK